MCAPGNFHNILPSVSFLAFLPKKKVNTEFIKLYGVSEQNVVKQLNVAFWISES